MSPSAAQGLAEVVDAEESLTPFAEGVWLARAAVRIVGMPLTSTMTVLQLSDGGLLLHSPIEMTPERRAAVESLGPVVHLYAPNLYHHLWMAQWASAFPSARLHGPPGLEKKRKDLRFDRAHGDPEPAFDGILDEVIVQGFRLAEGVLFHRPSRSLLVADLLHNIGRQPQLWTKIYATTMGFYDRIALSRAIRWFAFSDRQATRRSLDQLLSLPFDRIIVGHGRPVVEGAREALTNAYTWLPPAT